MVNYAESLSFMVDHMDMILKYLAQVEQQYEMETSLLGLINFSNTQPEKMAPFFGILCTLLANSNPSNYELNEKGGHLLHNYRDFFGTNWSTIWDKLNPGARNALSQRFSL